MSAMPAPVNCHVHLPPNFSAFASVEDAVARASQEGIRLLGASNYYDHRIYQGFSSLCSEREIVPLQGIEIVCWSEELAQKGWRINDPGNPGKVYLCGKSLRRLHDPTPRVKDLLARIRRGDEARMKEMAERLEQVCQEAGLQVIFSADQVAADTARAAGVDQDQVTLQERHLAQALQQRLFAALEPTERPRALEGLFGKASRSPEDGLVVQGEIRTHLMKAGKPAYVAEEFISLTEAMDLVRELEGIIAYPVVFDGMAPWSEFEQSADVLADSLEGLGIDHVEFIPNRNSPEALAQTVPILLERGMTLTAGTEHNTSEMIPLMPQCRGGAPLPSQCEEAFFQGALKLAEWQNPRFREELERHAN